MAGLENLDIKVVLAWLGASVDIYIQVCLNHKKINVLKDFDYFLCFFQDLFSSTKRN